MLKQGLDWMRYDVSIVEFSHNRKRYSGEPVKSVRKQSIGYKTNDFFAISKNKNEHFHETR